MDEGLIASPEFQSLAEVLARFSVGDWILTLSRLSDTTTNELIAVVGGLEGERLMEGGGDA